MQVALSLLLVIGAGLFHAEPWSAAGYRSWIPARPAVIATVDPTRNGYEASALRDFYQRVLAVRAAHARRAIREPRLHHPARRLALERRLHRRGLQFKQADKKYVDMNAVGPRFFRDDGDPAAGGTGVPRRGQPGHIGSRLSHYVNPGSARPETGPRFTIVNESFAKRYFAGAKPRRRACAGTRNTTRRRPTK